MDIMTRTRAKNKTVLELEKDEIFNSWFNSFDRINTQLSYSLRVFCEFTGAYPKDLVNEAREDYINRVPPWELHHVKRIDAVLTSLKNSMTYTVNFSQLIAGAL